MSDLQTLPFLIFIWEVETKQRTNSAIILTNVTLSTSYIHFVILFIDTSINIYLNIDDIDIDLDKLATLHSSNVSATPLADVL